jgi:hypothetical protein
MQRIFIKKCFLFTAGSVGSQLGGKRFVDDEEVETEARKWLRQRPKDFYAAGFDALLKRWENVSVFVEDMSRMSGLNITCFTFYVNL